MLRVLKKKTTTRSKLVLTKKVARYSSILQLIRIRECEYRYFRRRVKIDHEDKNLFPVADTGFLGRGANLVGEGVLLFGQFS